MTLPIDQEPSDLDEISRALEVLKLHSTTDLNANSNNSGQTSEAISTLANATKWNTSTRQRLADPHILSSLVEIVDSSLSDSLETVDLALRCIGNACIENDSAREVLTSIGFSWALRCLQTATLYDTATAKLTAQVLYNICFDFTPAQQQCYRDHVYHELIKLCAIRSILRSDEKTIIIELLFYICSHKPSDSDLVDDDSGGLRDDLLLLPSTYQTYVDAETFAMLVETCLIYLRDARFQVAVIADDNAHNVWGMLQQTELRISSFTGDEEDEKILVALSVSLIWCLSDMAALPEFVTGYDLNDRWIKEVIHIVGVRDFSWSSRLTTAACQILGNMLWKLRNPATFAHLVENDQLQEAILGILSSSSDNELLHSEAGLLIQLSRPPHAREIIGRDVMTRTALERLCRHETPEVKQAGVKLLRALGKECRANQERFADLANEVMSSSIVDDSTLADVPD